MDSLEGRVYHSPMENSRKLSVSRLGLVAFILFIALRYPFDTELNSLGSYASYLFEALFCLMAVAAYWKRLALRFRVNRNALLGGVGVLVLGMLVAFSTRSLGLVIPFNLRAPETILFLLGIGPVLEELIFRVLLWDPLVDLLKRPNWVLAITAVLFSLSHLYALFDVPSELVTFVWYQGVYTLLLGLLCGSSRLSSGTISQPILVHFLFNLGFWLGGVR